MIFDSFVGPYRPVSWTFQFWPVLLISFIFGVIGTWFSKKVALKYNIVDRPNDTVKTHKVPIAYLGGIGILVGFAVGLLTGMGCFKEHILLAAG
jgi:UDP-N-acetylmuramyl pentapeptide phosphotransferase/UDP-N-acetylglucosamine-1-phosphate transferase